MRFWKLGLCFALLLLVATSAITAQLSHEVSGLAIGSDTDALVLPNQGTIDERPFFSTRRHPAIAYDEPASDAVAELAHKVNEGIVQLRFNGRGGYLLSVMEALGVPAESQSVVFSKTSLQSHYISPSNPRAIFFSDNVSIAFIREAPLLELSALDPKQGVVFYALENRQSGRPQIVRSDSCLSCHETRNSLDVPGLLARSMGVGRGGETMPQYGNYVSDHRSPFEERWGGWFITGRPGTARHMGNEMLESDGTGRLLIGVPKPLGSLAGWFDPDGYPSESSDVAAVMILDHQVRMTNLLTRVGWETRIALGRLEKHPEEKETVTRLIAADSRELADYMLFVDEAPLPGEFKSLSEFPARFAAAGPKDSRGRGLKQIDLTRRLLRYPCSYMIYSRAFDALPDATRENVYARLWDVLSGKDKAAKYSRISSADRAAIVSILLETKPGLPAYYRRLEK
jgi:hypothetical protein